MGHMFNLKYNFNICHDHDDSRWSSTTDHINNYMLIGSKELIIINIIIWLRYFNDR